MMMTEDEILRLLEEQCQEAGIYFQAFIQMPYLYLYINREADSSVDHERLTEQIFRTIASHNLELQGISFHSRILGTVEPDWETYLQFPTPSVDSTLIEHEPLSEEIPVVEHHFVEPEVIAPVETTVNEPLPEPEPVQETAKPFELSAYCFIRNRALLTSKLQPPSAQIAELVDFFHVLPNKQVVISFLEDIFNRTQTPNTEHHLESIQQWVQELSELDGEKKRKASIWFSRYCFNPTETMEQLQPSLTPVVEETPTPSEPTEPQPVEETEPSLLTPSKAKPPISAPKTLTSEVTTSRVKKGSQKKYPTLQFNSIHLAIAWVIFTIFVLIINVRTISAALETSPLCANSPVPEQCKLAVQLVGSPGIELAFKSHPGVPSERTKAAAEFEGVTADVYTVPAGLDAADETCSFYATTKAGMKFKEVMKMRPKPLSTKGQIVLPGVYLVDVLQHNFQGGSEPIRTACVFRYQETKKAVKIDTLAIEVIPTQWPEEPYTGDSQSVSLQKAAGVFGLLSVLGTGTLFTAIGLLITVLLGLGIRANRLDTIFKAAFFLGIIETLLSLLPIFFILRMAGQILALGITSLVVKDFKVDWGMGYRVLAASALIIMGLRMVLNWIVFGLLLAWFM